jgi:metallo-beta-lactamase family protein
MKLSFHGAAREVTGSAHLIESDGDRVLLDCGMIQGGKERHERNREPFPFDLGSLSAVVLSHAHIDHSGRLPLLCKAGFGGPILATEATVDLCKILLSDSARIQEEDARWKIKRLEKKREKHDWVKPLYTTEDVDCILDRFEPVPFDSPRELAPGITVNFTRAGHILGAAIVQLEIDPQDGPCRTLTFSGDLGVPTARLVGGPAKVPAPDYLLIESTYGDREREKNHEKGEQLYEIIDRTVQRGGKVVIPSFAVGRTQAILAHINDLVEAKRLNGLPVFVDSPMAIAATKVFAMHPESYSEDARKLLHAGDQPLEFPGLEFTASVDESKSINDVRGPAVIISASGMATAGRIKHHLRNHITDRNSTILFVGYQAYGTLGRVIQQGTDPVRIFGDWYGVKASVETIEGFSAHADQTELLDWFGQLDGVPRKTWIVHGEEEAALTLGSLLRTRYGASFEVPHRGRSYELD